MFQPPGFGVCKFIPNAPKPCAAAVTNWTGAYDGVSINGFSLPLTDSSKGTCALGCPNCIDLSTTGQIAIPGLKQLKEAKSEHQNELNPMGDAEALERSKKKSLVIYMGIVMVDRVAGSIGTLLQKGLIIKRSLQAHPSIPNMW